MKWANRDIGNAAYYITGTITEWLPLLEIAEVRQRVCDDIKVAVDACGGALLAFVGVSGVFFRNRWADKYRE